MGGGWEGLNRGRVGVGLRLGQGAGRGMSFVCC